MTDLWVLRQLADMVDAKLRNKTTRRRAAGHVPFFCARSLKAISSDSRKAVQSLLAAGSIEQEV